MNQNPFSAFIWVGCASVFLLLSEPASATMAGGCYPPNNPECLREQRQREAQARARAQHEAHLRAERAREQRAAREAAQQQQQQRQQYRYPAGGSNSGSSSNSQQPARNLYGSLAIDSNHGQTYGWAVNFDSHAAADNSALSRCGGRCSVVMRFHNACAAYSADQVAGSSAFGWAHAANVSGAQSLATQYCQSRGGRSCVLRAWGCSTG